MGRWEPDAGGRLRRAALELYLERGFEQTTVAEIAERAGLTARTFFRYFADKREVLFNGASALQDQLVSALEAVPDPVPPLRAIENVLDAAAQALGENHGYARRRQLVITANAELRERELIKMASLATALADGLRRRGVATTTASLAAEAGVAVFRVAFEVWVGDAEDAGLPTVMRESLGQLRQLATG